MGKDLEALKAEYITTGITYRNLAAKYGVPFHVVARTAGREKWTQARRQRKENQGDDGANLKKLTALREAADNLAESINGILGDTERFRRYIVGESPDGEEAAMGKGFAKLDTKTIRDLTSTLKDLTLITRNLHNIPTTQEQNAMDITLERLKLYRQKAEALEAADSETGVVVLADVLEEEENDHGGIE